MNDVRFCPAGCASGFDFGCTVGPTIWIGCFHRKHWIPSMENDPERKHFYSAKYKHLSSEKKTACLIAHESVHLAIENVVSLETSMAYEKFETKVWNHLGTMI